MITRLPDPPQAEIISLEEIKEFCRIDGELDAVDESILVTSRDAAIETGEQETGIIWRAAVYEIKINPAACLVLPISPAVALVALTSVAHGGAEQAVAPNEYVFIPSDLENRRPWATLRPTSQWPEGAAFLKAKVMAGWVPDRLPQALRLWALNRIAASNDIRTDMQASTRETLVKMPREHSTRLLDRYRVMGGPGYGCSD